ncbi:MAG: hypothetical protein GEU74_14530 [Nitriliruptorales bacterium]|nr:hypothetical protein [Nitriliruptorales bacterium]
MLAEDYANAERYLEEASDSSARSRIATARLAFSRRWEPSTVAAEPADAGIAAFDPFLGSRPAQ